MKSNWRLSYGAGPFAAALLPFACYEWLKSRDTWDHMMKMPREHFYLVSATALLSFLIAALIGWSGSRLRNLKVSFLSLSFLSLSGIFLVHGLSTPGFLLDQSHLPGISAQISVVSAAFWLWMSSLHADHPVLHWFERWHKQLLPSWLLILAGYLGISMYAPHWMDGIPLTENPLKWVAMGITFCLSLSTVLSYVRSYRYARLPLQLAIVYSTCWLIDAQVIISTGELWRMSWWMYHFLLLAASIVMIAGFLRQYAAHVPAAQILRSLFSTDPAERIRACISPRIKALVVATESRDLYTAGHNFRVAMYALRLGEEMGLRPEQLRALAQGAVVHDVGKIQIPDSILNKPGRLTPEERLVIESHPAAGYEMCRRVGFMKDELDVIRHHHERWDGKGYPDQLGGESIPLLGRITAVADVYDALTSTRSYRVAWTHEAAIEHLLQGRGTQFDPDCVDAWVRLCSVDPDAYLQPGRMQMGSPALAAEAI